MVAVGEVQLAAASMDCCCRHCAALPLKVAMAVVAAVASLLPLS